MTLRASAKFFGGLPQEAFFSASESQYSAGRFFRGWLALASLALAPIAAADQLTVSWADNSDNESGFKIERAVVGAMFTEVALVGPNVTSYTDSSLLPSTAYSFRVRAFNASGDSEYSNV